MPSAETLALAGDAGTRLTYCLYGAADGSPVVFNTGTPGSRYLARKWTRTVVAGDSPADRSTGES